ncbi:MAG: glycoside hydrolase, partial [Thermoplasmata archaeon]|nr:glycoside hydrolase [Thermoplasmata archaeon]
MLLFLLNGLASASAPLTYPPAPSPGLASPATPTPLTGMQSPERLLDAPSQAPMASHLAPSPVFPTLSGSPTSGRGTFFTSQVVPQGGNRTCLSYGGYFRTGVCINLTNDPSVNLTSRGLLAVAYTAFVNNSICANVSGRTYTVIGFQTSSNYGGTWTAPRFFDNPNCSVALQYPSAMQPSLTSLSNGTLVLSYLEYSNFSSYGSNVGTPPYSNPPYLHYTRLVVQVSYNNGSTWSAGTVVNSTFHKSVYLYYGTTDAPPMRDWVTANGANVYVVWENFSYVLPGAAQIHLRVSRDGGVTFGKIENLPVITGDYAGEVTHVAVNPYVLALPSGELYVAYSTGWNYLYYTHYCAPYAPHTCESSGWTADVVVANSSTNGASWTAHVAASGLFTQSYLDHGPRGIFADPAPTLAYGARFGQLFVSYSAWLAGNLCEQSLYDRCTNGSMTEDVFVQNSSDGGANWSSPSFLSSLVNPDGGAANIAYNPSIGVAPDGTLDLSATYVNDTNCLAANATPYYSYPVCGSVQQVFLNSSDNASTFNGPFDVYPTYSVQPGQYDGEYATMVVEGSHVVLAWTLSSCAPSPYCSFPSTTSNASVVISELFTGAGLTVTFNETNLSAGTTWWAEMSGNYRLGPLGANLTVTGVPVGVSVEWAVPTMYPRYGVEWTPVVRTASPGSFAVPSVISVAYSEQVLLNISVIPKLVPVNSYYQPTNYLMSPAVGNYWIPVNTSRLLTVTFSPPSCTSQCEYWNLTFLSWTGTGPGSVSSNASAVKVGMRGPVNQTANFQFNDYCSGYGYGGVVRSFSCTPVQRYALTFAERGLPYNTSWSVRIDGNRTLSTNLSAISLGVTAAPHTYVVWTVPTQTPGILWVPLADAASPLAVPRVGVVLITFTQENVSGMEFPLNVSSSGLPARTLWSLYAGGAAQVVSSGGDLLEVAAGGNVSVTGWNVYTEAGVAYTAS